MASGSRSINKGSDQIFEHNCDACLTHGVTSEGISYCTVCKEYLCQPCERSHKGSKASRDHLFLTGSAVPSGSIQRKQVPPIMFCDTHKTSILEFICDDHRLVICNICKMTNHVKCRTAHVSHQVKKEKSQITSSFKLAVKDLSDLTDKFNNLQTRRQTDKLSLKANIQTCLTDVQQIRKKVNTKLDQLERKMDSKLREIEDELSKEIDSHEAMLKNILIEIGALEKSLNECQKSREEDVMFVGMKKSSSQKVEFEKILTNIQDAISPIDIRIEPNDILTDVIDQLDSLGTVVTGKSTKYSRPVSISVHNKTGADKRANDRRSSSTSLLNIEVTRKRETIDLSVTFASGCVFMTDGHLVVSCGDDGLQLFDKDFKYKSKLDIFSVDVATLNDTEIILTQGIVAKKLQRVRVLPDMKVVKTVKMDRRCYGVDVCGNELYVTCHDNPGNGEVRVLTMEGTVLRRLGVDDGNYMFTRPSCVKVSKDGSKVFISDLDADTVTCLSTQGRTLYTYTDRDIRAPVGLYVDEGNNLFVCGGGSHNIHVIRHDGQQEKILLSRKDGIQCTSGISYRRTDGCLAFVQNDFEKSSEIVTFTTKIQ